MPDDDELNQLILFLIAVGPRGDCAFDDDAPQLGGFVVNQQRRLVCLRIRRNGPQAAKSPGAWFPRRRG